MWVVNDRTQIRDLKRFYDDLFCKRIKHELAPVQKYYLSRLLKTLVR